MAAYGDLRERLGNWDVVLLDGAVGTQLQATGMSMDPWCWTAIGNHTHPYTVRKMHEDYFRAGVDVITTNTYSEARHNYEAARAAMSPIEREIADLLEARPNENESEVVTIFGAIGEGRWSGEERIEAAGWLEHRMKASNDKSLKWKEKSSARKPEKDKAYQRTLQVKRWLKGE